MEGQEGATPGTVDRIKRKIGQGLQRFGNYLKESTAVNRQIPLEAINDQAVAKAIRFDIWAEGAGLGERSDKPFSVTTILNQINEATLTDNLGRSNYQQENPKKREAVQKILSGWVREGIVEMVPLEQPDASKDTIYYQVINKEALRKLSSNDQIGFPAKP